jgi:hypothetical protein
MISFIYVQGNVKLKVLFLRLLRYKANFNANGNGNVQS